MELSFKFVSCILAVGLAMFFLFRGITRCHYDAICRTSIPISSYYVFSGKVFIWAAHFFCVCRYPFSTTPDFSRFDGLFDRETIKKIVSEGRWDDCRLVGFIESAKAPNWVSKILVELKQDPLLALKWFKWTQSQNGFLHTVENYCVAAHILFCSRMYHDAHDVLTQLVRLKKLGENGIKQSPCSGILDVLWLTRNVCRPGYGVFDALFNVLVELGLLEEARECFLRMRNLNIVPKARSCNILLHKCSKVTDGVFVKKFFSDMVGTGIVQSVYTYNIVIGYFCKEGNLIAAKSLFDKMKGLGIFPDVVTYNSFIDAHGKLGELDHMISFYKEMKEAGCNPDIITYNTLINCFCKFDNMLLAFNYLREMKERFLKPNVVTYSTFIDAFCKEGMLEQAIKFFCRHEASWSHT